MTDPKTNTPTAAQLSRIARTLPLSTRRFSIPRPDRDIANHLYLRASAASSRRGATYQVTEEIHAIILRIAQWLADPREKPWLLLMGLYGNGKSTLARALSDTVRAYAEQELGYNKFLVSYYDAKYLSELFIRDRAAFDRIADTDLLVIDDLGIEPKEVLAYGMTHTPVVDIITHRYNRDLMTVITTNLEGRDLAPRYGQRIVDRLHEQALTIPFLAPSFRKKSQNPERE